MDSKLRTAIQELSCYNGIFRQLWDLGRIHFVEDIPTACVTFDREGQQLDFRFNREFYDKLNSSQLAFIIAHECMHVILFHGKRFMSNKMLIANKDTFNVAADIAIHEIMEREFMFNIEQMKDVGLCTIESVFKEKAPQIEQLSTMEYYFNKLVEGCEVTYVPLDIHMFDENFADGCEGIVKKAFERLTDVEKKELQNKLKDIAKMRGEEQGNKWFNVTINPVKKKKWEMIIKEWAQAFLQSDRFCWYKPSRRTATLDSNLFLPSHLELEIKKTNVWLYMDTSGSCIDLAPRFFSAAASLPVKFFNARLFCFDTQVYETDVKSKKVYGGGGTAFDIIQMHISDQQDRPDFVFVITDGYGNQVKPERPDRWHVFLTTEDKSCFPDNCIFHSFDEFE